MTSKIHIKLGALEISYEGNEAYLKSELPKLVEKMASIEVTQVENLPAPKQQQKQPAGINSESINLSMESIASKTNVKTGTDLAFAACVYLRLVEEKETFTRADILGSMKKATSYCSNSHTKNLSISIKTLIGDKRLIQRSNGSYALSATAIKRAKSSLGNE